MDPTRPARKLPLLFATLLLLAPSVQAGFTDETGTWNGPTSGIEGDVVTIRFDYSVTYTVEADDAEVDVLNHVSRAKGTSTYAHTGCKGFWAHNTETSTDWFLGTDEYELDADGVCYTTFDVTTIKDSQGNRIFYVGSVWELTSSLAFELTLSCSSYPCEEEWQSRLNANQNPVVGPSHHINISDDGDPLDDVVDVTTA